MNNNKEQAGLTAHEQSLNLEISKAKDIDTNNISDGYHTF